MLQCIIYFRVYAYTRKFIRCTRTSHSASACRVAVGMGMRIRFSHMDPPMCICGSPYGNSIWIPMWESPYGYSIWVNTPKWVYIWVSPYGSPYGDPTKILWEWDGYESGKSTPTATLCDGTTHDANSGC